MGAVLNAYMNVYRTEISGGLVASGGLVSLLGVLNLIESCSSSDPAYKKKRLNQGMLKIAIGAGIIAVGAAVYLNTADPLNLESVKEFYSKKVSPLDSASIPDFSKKCARKTLKTILAQNIQPLNRKIFINLDCQTFLPWEENFIEKVGDVATTITGIQKEQINKDIMWGISPSKLPFITTTNSNASKVFSLVMGKNYYSMICDDPAVSQAPFLYGSLISPPSKDGELFDHDFLSEIFDGIQCEELKDSFISFVNNTFRHIMEKVQKEI